MYRYIHIVIYVFKHTRTYTLTREKNLSSSIFAICQCAPSKNSVFAQGAYIPQHKHPKK